MKRNYYTLFRMIVMEIIASCSVLCNIYSIIMQADLKVREFHLEGISTIQLFKSEAFCVGLGCCHCCFGQKI